MSGERNWVDRIPSPRWCAAGAWLVVTSATLTDGVAIPSRPGAGARHHRSAPSAASPARAHCLAFDNAAQTRIFVIYRHPARRHRPSRGDLCGVFVAARAARSLFTAITAARRAPAHRPGSRSARLSLLASTSMPMSTATLVEIFRAEEDSCLLGTDPCVRASNIPADRCACSF